MNSQKTVRKSVTLAKSRWAAYAMAGAATSLAGLAAAEAEIHYSGPINHHFTGNEAATFPLQDGAHLGFQHALQGSNRGFAHLSIHGSQSGPPSSIGLFGGKPNNPTSGFGFYVFRLASHHPISRNSMGASCFTTSWSSRLECFGATIQTGFGGYGSFTEPGQGFISFSFDTGAGRQYGWARIKTTGTPLVRFILIDYAWADVGETIVTGQKSSTETGEAVTKSGSLGLLATGAQGLEAWREQRQQVDSPVTKQE